MAFDIKGAKNVPAIGNFAGKIGAREVQHIDQPGRGRCLVIGKLPLKQHLAIGIHQTDGFDVATIKHGVDDRLGHDRITAQNCPLQNQSQRGGGGFQIGRHLFMNRVPDHG